MSDRVKKILRYFFMGLGLALFAVLINQLGVKEIWQQIKEVGWLFVPISLISLGWFMSTTMSWKIILSNLGHHLPFSRLLTLKLIAEGVNVVAPSANLGGEGLRVFYIKSTTGSDIATGSVILDKTMDNIAKMLFMSVGVLLSIAFLDIPDTWLWASILFLIFILGFNLISIILQIGGVFGKGAGILSKISFLRKRLEKHQSKFQSIDGHLKKSYQESSTTLIASTAWHFLRRILNILEVWLILWVLSGVTDPINAVFIMSLTTIANNVFFLIPGQWGVAEGSQVLLAEFVGLTAAIGLSLGVIRRIRLLLFTGIGLLLLQLIKKDY